MSRAQNLAALAGVVVLAVVAGFGLGRLTGPAEAPAPAPESARRALYWYDPMVPAQHFDKPGKSPFMDMQLIPKYAGDAPGGAGIKVDPAKVQNLGVRLASAERGVLSADLNVSGIIAFNDRDVAVVQARAAGFVQRVYGRAPGDLVPAGAPLADLLVPEWGGAQGEYLAVRRTGDPDLIAAARQRLQLLGMPASLIASVERSGRVRNVVTVSTPTGGAIKTLAVRNGMTVAAGETLAEVNGLGRVWLNAAVPEAAAGEVRPGQMATATLAAYPGESFNGRVTAILPQAEPDSRTLTARIELPNTGGRLRPGMFASVQLSGAAQPALLVPSEAVIRTGRRTLVMLAGAEGRYRPAEVRTGRVANGRTEVLAGLREGERVVASGQFLLDSEASLSGVEARPVDGVAAPATGPVMFEGAGRVEQVTPASITISHGPIAALRWPAMTMQFRLADPKLASGIKTGERVNFGFEQQQAGPLLRRVQRSAGQ